MKNHKETETAAGDVPRIEVSAVARENGLHGECLVATVTSGFQTYTFSQNKGERDWYCDAHFGKGWYPYFVHGTGGRSCMKQIATGELAEKLDAAKAVLEQG
jgi:hypothetical protein